jgi:hypothetical protein
MGNLFAQQRVRMEITQEALTLVGICERIHDLRRKLEIDLRERKVKWEALYDLHFKFATHPSPESLSDAFGHLDSDTQMRIRQFIRPYFATKHHLSIVNAQIVKIEFRLEMTRMLEGAIITFHNTLPAHDNPHKQATTDLKNDNLEAIQELMDAITFGTDTFMSQKDETEFFLNEYVREKFGAPLNNPRDEAIENTEPMIDMMNHVSSHVQDMGSYLIEPINY